MLNIFCLFNVVNTLAGQDFDNYLRASCQLPGTCTLEFCCHLEEFQKKVFEVPTNVALYARAPYSANLFLINISLKVLKENLVIWLKCPL